MRILVTGSSGHLGEAVARTLRARGDEVVAIDIKPGRETSSVGSIVDRAFVRSCMAGVDVVLHAATLHKPHVVTHTRQDFVDVNVSGTLNLLEEAGRAGTSAFVFTSTTSAFGQALTPNPESPAVWVTEELRGAPKNIYGATKVAAEELCELFHARDGLPCIVLRTSRFFPEEDDSRSLRNTYPADNIKVNEFLYRRVDVEDAVSAHLLAIERARDIGFGRYIISATTPFTQADLRSLRRDAPEVVRRVTDFEEVYRERGWRMAPTIERVYVNERARTDLGWHPKHDFVSVLRRLKAGESWMSPLAQLIGSKRYHDVRFDDGPFPVEEG